MSKTIMDTINKQVLILTNYSADTAYFEYRDSTFVQVGGQLVFDDP